MNLWLLIAAINGALAVAAGAFGAHGLKARLDPDHLQIFETAVRYHMYHALAMGLSALAARNGAASTASYAAAGFFLAGIILFSGSLYLLALTNIRALGIITPFGGLAFLAGWIALAWAAAKVV